MDELLSKITQELMSELDHAAVAKHNNAINEEQEEAKRMQMVELANQARREIGARYIRQGKHEIRIADIPYEMSRQMKRIEQRERLKATRVIP